MDLEDLTEKLVEMKIDETRGDLWEEIRLHSEPVLLGRFHAKCSEAKERIVGLCSPLLRLVQSNSPQASTSGELLSF